jgi:hypothetical protein
MTEHEWADVAEDLFGFYNKRPHQKTLAFWFAELRSYPEHVVRQAVIDQCNNERYMPTIAEFKKRLRRPGKMDGPEPDPDLTPEEVRFDKRIFPLFNRFLELMPTLTRERQEELFGVFMTEKYGIAVQEGVAGRIDWTEYEGVFGFHVPSAWVKAGKF